MKKTINHLLFVVLAFVLITINPYQSQAGISNSNIKETTEFNRNEIEAKLGRKLTLKERFALKVVERKQQNLDEQSKIIGVDKTNGRKSQLVALLLCIFLGGLGIHRFYLGYTGMGLLYLFTAGLAGIGWVIDIILLIIPNGLTPKGQTSYK